MEKMVKLLGVKVKGNYYISIEREGYYPSGFSFDYIINGKEPGKTFHKNWALISEVPVLMQRYRSQENINHRFELIDKSLESDKIPFSLLRDDVTYKDEDYDTVWIEGPYKIYSSMYSLVSDSQEDILENIEFEYKTIMEVDSLIEFDGFSYQVQRTQWAHEGLRSLTEKEVKYQLLDEIIFPEIVLPSRPCELTPKQTYKIVRQYIKQNINLDFASITSDYNFCFTVKKRIPLSEIEKYSVDTNWAKKTKRVKLETRYRKYREVECFAMTGEGYGGYPMIRGFRGDNQEDLKNKIDNYCKELILFINDPVSDCPHCKGLGVILPKEKKEKNNNEDS